LIYFAAGKGLQTVPKKGSDEMLISVLITQLVQIKSHKKVAFYLCFIITGSQPQILHQLQHHRLYQPTC
jgi:hypothetical protein